MCPKTGAIDWDDVAMVKQSIQDSRSNNIITEDLPPFLKGFVSGDDYGAMFIPSAN